MSCGVDRRRVLNPVLLWLWYRPAVTAPIGPLAWESPVVGAVLKKKKKKELEMKKEKLRWTSQKYKVS